jgi:YVTN family beta-propeller protein
VLQANAAGDNIHVIDPATNLVVGTIEDIEVPHGVAIAPDGGRIYVTNESLSTLDVVDARTLKVFKRIPLSGRPNNVAVSKNGGGICGGLRGAGAVDGRHRPSQLKSDCIEGASQRVVTPGYNRVAVADPDDIISTSSDTAGNGCGPDSQRRYPADGLPQCDRSTRGRVQLSDSTALRLWTLRPARKSNA